MTQSPLGSGFGHHSTATEVLAGIDLTGRVAVVTGGYSGIGIETTRALVGAGATVVVPARRPDQAREQLAGIERTSVDELDLADQASVASFAEGFLAANDRLDLLVNNAGIMACPEARVGPGWELQLATNHLGHYALANRLRPALGEGSRVVALSSSAIRYTGIRFDDLMFERDPYDPWLAYGQSKTADALFARHLDRLGAPHGIHAYSLDPGGILTPLQRHMPREELVERGWIAEDGTPQMTDVFKSTEQGAATTCWAATSPLLEGHGGVFCQDCDVAPVSEGDEPGVRRWAVDPADAERLWAVSAELTGLDAFG